VGFWHWLTGTEAADPRVSRQSAQSLRKALLGLNRDDLAWALVPDADDDEILVAGWKYKDPHWRKLLFEAEVSSSIRIKVFLDEARGTVRSVDEQVDVGLFNTPDGAEIGVHGFRGQKAEVGAHFEFGRKADGKFGVLSRTVFRTNDIKHAMQDTARKCGWGWKGVSFGRLKRSQR
jgi:hypothetical protein